MENSSEIINYWQHRQQPSVDADSIVQDPAALGIACDLGSSVNTADDGDLWSTGRQAARFNSKIMKNNDKNNDYNEK